MGDDQGTRARLVACAERVLRDRHEAEDVVQEVYLRARAASAPVGEGFLWATCYRLAFDRLRARKRHAKALARIGADAPVRSSGGDEGTNAIHDADEVRRALDGLPDPYRSALALRYLDELPFGEVAARLGTIERTARTWVARGLERLRKKLEEPS